MPFDPEAFLRGGDAAAAPPSAPAAFDPEAFLRGGPAAPVALPSPAPDVPSTASVITGAAAPYIAAGLMGGSVAGLPGVLGGLGTVALTDLATGAYNLAAPLFGGRRMVPPSETIRNYFVAGGIGKKPVTPEQNVLAETIEGALGAIGGVGAGRTLGGRIGNFFAQQPVVQTVAGAIAGGAPEALRQYGGVENPYALFTASLLGGGVGAKTGTSLARTAENLADRARQYATKANISSEALRERAQAAFNATDASGVVYDAPALTNMAQQVRRDLIATKYDPTSPRYTAVNEALARVDEFAQKSQSISNLHSLRQDLTKVYRPNAGPDGGRLIDEIVNNLDDFISNPSNATFASAADVKDASKTLKSAISDWSKLFKSNQIEELIERAVRNSSADSGPPIVQSLRTQFRTIANNPRKLSRFSAEEREAIKQLATGANESKTLRLLSTLAPTFKLRDVARTGAMSVLGATGAATGSVPLMATAATMSGAGLAARGARNYLSQAAANELAAAMRRGDVRAAQYLSTSDALRRAAPISVMQVPYDESNQNAMAR